MSSRQSWSPPLKGIYGEETNGSDFAHEEIKREINLDNLYSSLIGCFSVILCGYVAGRFHLISQKETKGLDVFVRCFSLPAVIFLSLAQLDLAAVNWKFLGSILVSKSLVFSGVVIVTLFLIRPINLSKIGLYAVFCTQSNDFALGYPILRALYDKDNNYPSYVYLLAPISLAILNPIACILFEVDKIRNSGEPKSGFEITGRKLEKDEQTLENIGNSSKQNSNNGRKSDIQLCYKVLLNIATNPIMIMTILGLIGNLFYTYIKFVEIILNALAKVFSTSALFALGLHMVGSVHKLKGIAMITPGILIITKLLVFPLITREMVSILHTGNTPNDTLNLSTFGFIYGTFPSAPMVFVLAKQYNVDVDIMASALVVCTFLSAPLMYVSSKMLYLEFSPDDSYYEKLESLAFSIGLVGIPIAVWLIVLLIANRSCSKVPQKVLGFLIISQILICIGVALKPLTEIWKPWPLYLQFFFLTFGIYSSRLWTMFLAITLVLLQSRSLCFTVRMIPAFAIFAWGVPGVAFVSECLASSHNFESLLNPDFRYGKFRSVFGLIVLVVSFFGTSIALILQHRYQRRFSKYLNLVHEVNSKDLQEAQETMVAEKNHEEYIRHCSENCSKINDIEDLGQEGTCENEGLCSSAYNCTDTEREICEQTVKDYNDRAINEDLDEDHRDHQISRHVVLLLFLVMAMFVNLMLSVWTLVIEDAFSGIYIELVFLNVFLNVGQLLITFSVFGFDTKSLFSNVTKRWRKFYYGADFIVLTPVEDLGFETTHVCDQFIAHHLRECESEIAEDKRLKLRVYKKCFKGKTLVSWLTRRRLAKTEVEATQYACHLLEGRVLRHIENRYHFENSNLLYTFSV